MFRLTVRATPTPTNPPPTATASVIESMLASSVAVTWMKVPAVTSAEPTIRAMVDVPASVVGVSAALAMSCEVFVSPAGSGGSSPVSNSPSGPGSAVGVLLCSSMNRSIDSPGPLIMTAPAAATAPPIEIATATDAASARLSISDSDEAPTVTCPVEAVTMSTSEISASVW